MTVLQRRNKINKAKENITNWWNSSDNYYTRTLVNDIVDLGKEIYKAGPALAEMFTPVYSDVKFADWVFNNGLKNFLNLNYLSGMSLMAVAPVAGAMLGVIPDFIDTPIKAGTVVKLVDQAVDFTKLSKSQAKAIYDDLMEQQTKLLDDLTKAEGMGPTVTAGSYQPSVYSTPSGTWLGTRKTPVTFDYSKREATIQSIKDQINAVNEKIRQLTAAGHDFTGYVDTPVREIGAVPNSLERSVQGWLDETATATKKTTPTTSTKPTAKTEAELMAKDKANTVQVSVDNRKYSSADRKIATSGQTRVRGDYHTAGKDNLSAGLDFWGNPKGTSYHNLENYNLGYQWDPRKGFQGNFNQLKKFISEKHPDIKYYHDESVWKYLLKNFPELMRLSGYLITFKQGGILNYLTLFK